METYKGPVTKPWNEQMHAWNDAIGDQMRGNIADATREAFARQKLTDLWSLANLVTGIRHDNQRDGSMLVRTILRKVNDVPNWWLNQEYERCRINCNLPQVGKMIGYNKQDYYV